MRKHLAIFLIWAAATGAAYEWGGAAARGVRELKKGDPRRAGQSLREGRPELPQSAAVRYDQALAFRGAGLSDSALAAYRDASGSPLLRGDPARASAAFNLGNDAMRAENFGQATRLYRESLRIDPKRADAKRNLEEAIRRSRNQPPSPQAGGGGGKGPPSKGNGKQGKGQTSQEPGPQPDQQNGQQQQPQTGTTPQLGKDIPDRSEAEHWLDALEAERRAARLRDRGGPEQERGQRDW